MSPPPRPLCMRNNDFATDMFFSNLPPRHNVHLSLILFINPYNGHLSAFLTSHEGGTSHIIHCHAFHVSGAGRKGKGKGKGKGPWPSGQPRWWIIIIATTIVIIAADHRGVLHHHPWRPFDQEGTYAFPYILCIMYMRSKTFNFDWPSISLQLLPKKFADYLDGQEPAKVYL